jgi:glycosyltransferase involved in cell wall biosynthesis
VLEAMARARPVIGSAVGGIPELIEDGVTGMLVPPGDVSALAIALERLLADAALRARLGASARTRVGERFTPEAQISALSELVERGLAHSGFGG